MSDNKRGRRTPRKTPRKKSGPVLPRSEFDILYQKIPDLVLDEWNAAPEVIEWPV